MARGKKVLYPAPAPDRIPKRPRNYFLPERNECLVHRYYYYAYLLRLSYEQCLSLLEQEFFLKEITIINLLTDQLDAINELSADEVTVSELRERFPHLVWKEAEVLP